MDVLNWFLTNPSNRAIIPIISPTNAPTTARTNKSPVNKVTISEIRVPITPNMSVITFDKSDKFAILIN